MNSDWAVGELRRFLMVSENARQAPQAPIAAQWQIVEQILNRVVPDWAQQVQGTPLHRWLGPREAANRAIVQLERQAELDANLGENAPRLSAADMHPWAWEGARSLWETGHFAEAIGAATRRLNAETQNKVSRRDVTEQALLQECFSNDDPKPGRPRLRPSGDDGGRTAIAVRRGIVALGEGVYAALRNPVSHDQTELDEQVALEQLAVISLLSRWVHDATVMA